MPIGGRKVAPVAVEKEHAIVVSTISGREVDLSTMWNRMFEPRVLTDYGPDGFAAISALPGGESLEVVLRLWQVRASLPSRHRGRLWPPQDSSQGADRHGADRGSRPVAVHDLRQLRAGVPQTGRHGRGHAGGAGSCSCPLAGSGRAPRGLREDLSLWQRPRPEPASSRKMGRDRRCAGADPRKGPRPCRRAVLCRGLLELPSTGPGQRARAFRASPMRSASTGRSSDQRRRLSATRSASLVKRASSMLSWKTSRQRLETTSSTGS